jgi:exodeoxyribonuclease-5
MQLTKDQQLATERIERFLRDSTKSVFGFFGYGGTGKTTLLNRIVRKYEGQVLNTASTNKATSVMKYFHTNFGNGTKEEFVTTYKLFGYKLVPIYNREEEQWEDKMVKSNMWDYPFDDQGIYPPLVVIDESSMIPEWFYKKLLDYAEEFNLKILFVGDSGQLPPVKEKTSPVFTLADSEDDHTLMKEIVRQKAGSNILDVATRIRDDLFAIKHSFTDLLPSEQVVKSREELGNKAVEFFKQSNDFTDTKVIAWRNTTVTWYNNYIRSKLRAPLVSNKECPFVVGDPVVNKRPVYKGLENILYTSQEMIVQAVGESTRSGISTFLITLKSKYEPKVTVHMVKPSNYKTYLSRCKYYKTKAQRSDDARDWAIYRQFAYGFAELDFSYAITSHRAQGSTYKNVFIDAVDICDNPNIEERNKCLYVAASRPTESIYIRQ